MSFSSDRTNEDTRRLAFARVRDAAFDAVYSLWLARKAEGMTQKDISEMLNRDQGWVSRSLAGPGNWTLRTFGELVHALNGHVEITAAPIEKLVCKNYDIYADIASHEPARSEPIDAQVHQYMNAVRVSLQAPNVTVSSPPRVEAGTHSYAD